MLCQACWCLADVHGKRFNGLAGNRDDDDDALSHGMVAHSSNMAMVATGGAVLERVRFYHVVHLCGWSRLWTPLVFQLANSQRGVRPPLPHATSRALLVLELKPPTAPPPPQPQAA